MQNTSIEDEIGDKAAKELLASEKLKAITTDLLEALQDICQAYAWLTFGEARGWSESKPLTMQESLDKSKAAINKALGVQA